MLGNQGELHHQTIDSVTIRQINLQTANECQRYLIGRDEAHVRHISTRLQLASKQWQPKMQLS